MKPIRNLMRERKKKLDSLEEKGINPYAYSYNVKNFSKQILNNFSKYENKTVSLAGRVMNLRTMGKISFGDLLDREGNIQFSLRKDLFCLKQWARLKILIIRFLLFIL